MTTQTFFKRLGIVVAGLLALLVILGVGGAIWLRTELRRSLPTLDGDVTLAGLEAPATVDRDTLGVPTIRAASMVDLARTLGWIHAQDRFFQMDLYRRSAAGELAGIAGRSVVAMDRAARIHRLRDVARRSVERLPADQRGLLDAYAAGVNAGVLALGSRPFEYLAFRADPEPWKPEDSVLVLLAMFADLNEEGGETDAMRGVLHEALPEPLAVFLDPPGSEWDTPLVGDPIPDPPMPGPEVFDLRGKAAVVVPGDAARAPAALRQPAAARTVAAPREGRMPPERPELGSNAFAVAESLSGTGRALLANDMHLSLSVPNVWYRAALHWLTDVGDSCMAVGVTLPGLPLLVAGSNCRVAWGLTYSYGDWTDLVVLEGDPDDDARYRTPDGWKTLEVANEIIRVNGESPETLAVESTIWGPVIGRDGHGRRVVSRWTAHDPEAVDLNALGLMAADSLVAALDAANRSGVPGLNLLAADTSGRIGWTIAGRIPRRVGTDGRLPASWADGTVRWDGYLAPDEVPRIVDPELGRLWSANQRSVDGEALAKIGDGGYALGARARQIRDDLMDLDAATERDLLAIQLDDRALFLERWESLMASVLSGDALVDHPRRRELRETIDAWGERASVESAGYRMVRGWRLMVKAEVWEPFEAVCRRTDERFDPWIFFNDEGPLWRLVTGKPEHLLNPKYASWDSLLLAAADTLLARYEVEEPLASRTWGEANRLSMRHPLSLAVPWLSRYLDMPPDELPGDTRMPRVQRPSSGASERFVVSPGREAEGIFHLPGGESGHPMSPYYRKGHEDWAHGRPTPFLPGATVHHLRLMPRL